jgi:hypothetical protein
MLSILMVLLISGVFGLYIVPEQAGEAPHFVLSPQIKYLGPDNPKFPFQGQLIYGNEKTEGLNMTGKVLMYESNTLITKEDMADRLAEKGLLALIFIFRSPNLYPGISEYSKSRLQKTKNPFPVFEITQGQNKTLEGWFNNQSRVMVSFDFEEKSPWDQTFKYFIPIFANILLFWTGIILLMTGYKFTLLIAVNGVQISIAQSVLALNFVCLSIRLIWLVIDPWGAYGQSRFLWVQIGMSLPFAFCISGTLLITIYWHEMIHRSGSKINMFLNHLLIPFIVACCFLFGFELATCVARGLGARVPVLVILDGVVYAIIIICLLIFFAITKVRLTHVFNRINKQLNATKKERLTVASNIVVAMGCVMFVWIITLLFIASGKFFWIPAGFITLNILLLGGMNLLCLLQVLLIRAPQRPWKWIFCGLFINNPDSLLNKSRSTFASSEETSKLSSSRQ